MALSIVSINANGLRDANKRSGFLQWLRSFPTLPDIVCIQECHVLSLEECQTWFSCSGFLCAVSSGSSHSCGCIILFRYSCSLCNSWHDDDGRFVQCEFSVSDEIFRVVCLYAPNRNPERDSFFDDLVVHVDPSVPTVLCGDFNAVFDRSKDRRGSHVDDISVRVALLFVVCSTLVVSWMCGGTCILTPLALPGLGGMARSLLVLTLLAVPYLGSRLSLPVRSALALFLTTVPCVSVFLSLKSSHLVQVFGLAGVAR